ncbi:hypothetical protein QQP08_000116, partial [Theobroma cacao]
MSMEEELAEGANSPNWANIVGDILRCIANKTHSIQDRVQMGAVHPSWQASLKDKNIIFPISNLPIPPLHAFAHQQNESSEKLPFAKLADKAWTLLLDSDSMAISFGGNLNLSHPRAVEFTSGPSMHAVDGYVDKELEKKNFIIGCSVLSSENCYTFFVIVADYRGC